MVCLLLIKLGNLGSTQFHLKIKRNKQMREKKSAILYGIILILSLTTLMCKETPVPSGEQGQSAAKIIKKSLDEKGEEASRDIFSKIFRDKDRYLFDEQEFINMSLEYLKSGKPQTAAVVLEMTAEVFPESLTAIRLLAHSYYMAGDEEKSFKAQTRMISARAQAQLPGFLEKNKDSLASTAEEVIDRCLEAMGGRQAWEDIKTMVVVFSLQSSSGNQPRMVRMYKRPALFRQGLEGAPNFTTFDGTHFWIVRNGEWSENTNAHIRLVSMDKWLINYERMGISHDFVGFDFINGSPVYHLHRTYRDSFVEDLYFSATTHLLTEIRSDYIQNWPFMKSFLTQWNYREVEGIKLPFVFIRNVGSLEPPHGGVVEEVRINVPLDDTLFFPPEHKK